MHAEGRARTFRRKMKNYTPLAICIGIVLCFSFLIISEANSSLKKDIAKTAVEVTPQMQRLHDLKLEYFNQGFAEGYHSGQFQAYKDVGEFITEKMKED